MEKDQFIAVEPPGWWLLEVELDPALDERRRALGECWSWTELRWYAERLKIEEVYQFLELNRADLLRELDEANDLYRRQKWLDDLIKAKKPAEAAAPDAAQVAPRPGGAKPVQTAAPKKASAFGSRTTTQGTPADSPAAPNTPTPASAEASPAAEAAQPRKPSPFAKKAAARATEPAAPGAAANGAAESIEQIKESLSQLAADPNVPVSAQEVEQLLKDPNFATNLAQAEAAIEAELEAELARAEARA